MFVNILKRIKTLRKAKLYNSCQPVYNERLLPVFINKINEQKLSLYLCTFQSPNSVENLCFVDSYIYVILGISLFVTCQKWHKYSNIKFDNIQNFGIV